MPGAIMFGDMAGDRADYIKGKIYSSRMTLPGENGEKGSIVSTKNMRKLLTLPSLEDDEEGKREEEKERDKKGKEERKEDDDEEEEEEDDEEMEEDGEEETEVEKTHEGQSLPLSSSLSSVENSVWSSSLPINQSSVKDQWEEHFQAGVQFWVHVKTGNVSSTCPYKAGVRGGRNMSLSLSLPSSTEEKKEEEDDRQLFGGFAPEMTASQVCDLIQERKGISGLLSSTAKGGIGEKRREEEEEEEEKKAKEEEERKRDEEDNSFWRQLIGADEEEERQKKKLQEEEKRKTEEETEKDQSEQDSKESTH